MDARLDFGQTPTAEHGDVVRMVMAGLQLSAVFAGLSDIRLQEVADKVVQRQVEDGDVLCHQDDTAHTVWLVLDGWVKLTRETLDGSEAVWDVLGQGHIVGLETLTEPYRYTTRAVAAGDGCVFAIPHSILRKMVDSEPRFTKALLQNALRQQQDERLDMEHRTQQTAPQRIGCFLLRLAGTPDGGTIDMQLPFDKGLVAARLGMQPETFSRALAKLRAESGMEMTGSHVRMDVGRMSAYVCGACSGVYPCRGC